MEVVLTNDSGKLKPGEDSFCVLFLGLGYAPPVEVNNVSIDFRLLVGRIMERRIAAQLAANGIERYCGRIDPWTAILFAEQLLRFCALSRCDRLRQCGGCIGKQVA